MESHPPEDDCIEICTARLDELPAIGELAREIWRAYYPGIITGEQIEYMLAQRYSPETMRQAMIAGELTYEQVFSDGRRVGFAAHGPSDRVHELKLHQLYVLPGCHGRGLGRKLLEHVSMVARERGFRSIALTVNKRNERALRFYRQAGFTIRAAIVVDIGNGFAMDDYVMARPVMSSPGCSTRE